MESLQSDLKLHQQYLDSLLSEGVITSDQYIQALVDMNETSFGIMNNKPS